MKKLIAALSLLFVLSLTAYGGSQPDAPALEPAG